jgi:hypothetical protein
LCQQYPVRRWLLLAVVTILIRVWLAFFVLCKKIVEVSDRFVLALSRSISLCGSLTFSASLEDKLKLQLSSDGSRVREWYGWHFPELCKLLPRDDEVLFAKVVRLLGT